MSWIVILVELIKWNIWSRDKYRRKCFLSNWISSQFMLNPVIIYMFSSMCSFFFPWSLQSSVTLFLFSSFRLDFLLLVNSNKKGMLKDIFYQQQISLYGFIYFSLSKFKFRLLIVDLGGLGVTCSPRGPRFADSNPAEVDGFFQNVKILSTRSPRGTFSWGTQVWDFRLVKELQAWKNRLLSKI